MSCPDDTRIAVDTQASRLLDLLETAGHEAYVVGGCVRDALMGRKPHDWDIATSALPNQTRDVMLAAGFAVAETGLKHGTITVIADHVPFEVTTYRADGSYADGRHPSSVQFLPNIEGDLSRRDFTINAMAYSPARGLVDLNGGVRDIAAKTIRCVGDAHERFAEDALRILRALRFASVLGFAIDVETAAQVHACRALLQNVSVERIWAEFSQLLCGVDAVPVLREYRDVVAVILPEIEPEFDFEQRNPYHKYDVWEHTLHALASAPPSMGAVARFAVLLHDIGKPSCFTLEESGRGHMYGHEAAGAKIAAAVCRRMHLGNKESAAVVHLVGNHMFNVPDTPRLVRRFIMKHGKELAPQLIQVRKCDKSTLSRGIPMSQKLADAFEKCDAIMAEQLASDGVFCKRDLAVNGGDLIEMGYVQGPAIGRALDVLLDEVVDEKLPNTREALLARAADLPRE